MADYRLFTSKAPNIMRLVMSDFGFDTTQAAAVLGNIGHECAGFHVMQEGDPVGGGRGGYGWCQWTGPRRRTFESYAARNGLSVDSDAANYGFMKLELTGTEKASVRILKGTSGLIACVRAFEQAYLRAGIKHYPSRERYAEIALAAYRGRSASAQTIGAESSGWGSPDEEVLGLESSAAVLFENDAEAIGAIEATTNAFDATSLLDRVAATASPTVHGTSEWGANPPKAPVTLLAQRPRGIVIHHTTQPNISDASLGHAFQIARQIQDFHMGPERNWIDTGQHFTVSRGGHIMEGRHRSLEAALGGSHHVLGAHAGPACNRDYIGIENEGTYTSALPPREQWDALVGLCSWLMRQYGMATDGIIGHRQCKSTECPGDKFFGALSQLRHDVGQVL